MAITYRNPHQQSYLAAQQEMDKLVTEQDQLRERLIWVTERLGQLAAYIKAVTPLLQQEPGQDITEAGLTELCRGILEQEQRWITPQEVRHLLALMGADIGGYSNPMAVLHAVLKRVGQTMKDSGGAIVFAAPGVLMPAPGSPPDLSGLTNLFKSPPVNKLVPPSSEAKKNPIEGPNLFKGPGKK